MAPILRSLNAALRWQTKFSKRRRACAAYWQGVPADIGPKRGWGFRNSEAPVPVITGANNRYAPTDVQWVREIVGRAPGYLR